MLCIWRRVSWRPKALRTVRRSMVSSRPICSAETKRTKYSFSTLPGRRPRISDPDSCRKRPILCLCIKLTRGIVG